MRVKVKLNRRRRVRTEMTSSELFIVAGASGTDPRTVRKYWDGLEVQSGVATRIDQELCKAGLLGGKSEG